MSATDLEAARFPIGPFQPPSRLSASERKRAIDAIERLPALLREAVEGLTEAQLDTPYRERGWTVRQVVHHLADSHMNAYVRLKLALTEDHPTIRPYEEARWAEVSDARTLSVNVSLRLLEGLHERWVTTLRALEDADFSRTFDHPEQGTVRLDQQLAMYAWHGEHHVAHIRRVAGR